MSEEIKVIDSNSKLGAILNRYFAQSRSPYIEIGSAEVVLPEKYKKFSELYKNFENHDDDVFVLSYPKTGSGWTQEMVWLLLNNLDFKKASEVPLYFRSAFFEAETLFDVPSEMNNLKYLNNLETPRCIKSHLHWSLLPNAIRTGAKQPKIIVILRGPEDVCTSYYHQAKIVEGYSGNWDDFCELFLGGKVLFGSYWKHALSFWEQRHRPNIMFIKYSAMKDDLFGSIRDVAAFLNKTVTDEEISKMVEHLKFDNLKKSKGFNLEDIAGFKEGEINPFVRSGKVGGHKDVMSSEMIEAFKQQTAKYLDGTGLSFD